jgi:hypothetical protein
MSRRAVIEKLSFAQALTKIAGQAPVQQPPDAFNAKSNFLAKSLLVPEAKDALSNSALKKYFAYVVDTGSKYPGQWVFTIRLIGGAGSKVPSKGDSWSAVSNRKSLWIVQHDGQTQQKPAELQRFVEGSTSTLQTAAGGSAWGSFAPFVDPTFSNQKAHEVYFSPGTYSKLKVSKKKWDPKNMFQNPHSVKA